MGLDIFNILFILEQIPQPFSYLLTYMILSSVVVAPIIVFVIKLLAMLYGNILSSHCIPLYSILNQPHCLVSFRFGEITPRFGASKNIVRKFESIFESSKFLYKLSSNEETLQIHRQILVQT